MINGHPKVAFLITPEGKQTWPKTMPEQVAVIRVLLTKRPQSCVALASQFKRKPVKAIEQVLAALEVLGHVKKIETQWHRL
jgi:antitoxin component HigA of HigAB toxin-antitoxin module